ncbi:hypothetical protein SKAU_G00414490 [Synaphobranchus kaupii]|uniref:Uncharacterized protein n=1 Tax=Synaphobranchus kaupii TaxID=118154 RepID=A0A9Q1E754_SYNKA|nr:hypothetical protein SKAU_G00414490 [Synaphobranchus kaupii]
MIAQTRKLAPTHSRRPDVALVGELCPLLPVGSPRSVARFSAGPGVSALIICTDRSLSPRGCCLSAVALDHIDTAMGRRRGGGGGPGPGSSLAALLGRLMNVQDFRIFTTQANRLSLQ